MAHAGASGRTGHTAATSAEQAGELAAHGLLVRENAALVLDHLEAALDKIARRIDAERIAEQIDVAAIEVADVAARLLSRVVHVDPAGVRPAPVGNALAHGLQEQGAALLILQGIVFVHEE